MEAKDFEREDRYAVIKYKKLTVQQWTQVPKLLEKFDSARVDCVVVEKDWPEYRLVWAMLEHRMAGNPVPDFNLWRQADDLQQRLTVAEQWAADLKKLLCDVINEAPTGFAALKVDLANRVNDALKPAAEGEGS